ncbi:MAG: hypothetical protein HOC71_06215 [Candidatus Latescibacteria bacterium]|jgi:hypothetical protein|nr:hypothetical protein [Candidatus Latescibacterota bacterium]
MSRLVKISCLLLFVLLLSCTVAKTTSVTPELRRKAVTIKILTPEEVGSRKYSIICEVSEFSEISQNVGPSPGEVEAAKNKLKLVAAKADADAIVNYLLEINIHPIHGARVVVCTGDAIKWTE